MWGHVNWSSYFQQLEVSSLDYVSAVPAATILWLLNSEWRDCIFSFRKGPSDIGNTLHCDLFQDSDFEVFSTCWKKPFFIIYLCLNLAGVGLFLDRPCGSPTLLSMLSCHVVLQVHIAHNALVSSIQFYLKENYAPEKHIKLTIVSDR